MNIQFASQPSQKMGMKEIEQIVGQMRPSSEKGKDDGTRIHVHYRSCSQPDQKEADDLKRAIDLGLPLDRYTGRAIKIWRSKEGDLLLTMLVELERDRKCRTLNLTKGLVFRIVILGD